MLGSPTQEQEIKRLIAEMQHNEWSLGFTENGAFHGI